MSPLEIWCNESQERYVLAVAPEQLPLFDELCRRERAPYAVIGEATAEQHLSLSDSHFNDQPIDPAAGRPARQNAENDPRRADSESSG